MIHRFKKDNKFASGGKRPGSGRPPDWYKQECQNIGTGKKALAFLAAVVNGDPVEKKILTEGTKKPISIMETADVDSRLKAWNSVMDRGFGRAIQAVEHSGNVATTYNLVITDPHD